MKFSCFYFFHFCVQSLAGFPSHIFTDSGKGGDERPGPLGNIERLVDDPPMIVWSEENERKRLRPRVVECLVDGGRIVKKVSYTVMKSSKKVKHLILFS